MIHHFMRVLVAYSESFESQFFQNFPFNFSYNLLVFHVFLVSVIKSPDWSLNIWNIIDLIIFLNIYTLNTWSITITTSRPFLSLSSVLHARNTHPIAIILKSFCLKDTLKRD